jgi:hypothetical protein
VEEKPAVERVSVDTSVAELCEAVVPSVVAARTGMRIMASFMVDFVA